MSTSGTDCAECRALLALLAENEDRACRELRRLLPGERTKLVQACRRLVDLCGRGDLRQVRDVTT